MLKHLRTHARTTIKEKIRFPVFKADWLLYLRPKNNDSSVRGNQNTLKNDVFEAGQP